MSKKKTKASKFNTDLFEGGNIEIVEESLDKSKKVKDLEMGIKTGIDMETQNVERTDAQDYREKRVLYMRRLSRSKESMFTKEVESVPSRYSVLWYGLKKNHPRNVALVHPIVIFLTRRLLFALLIVAFAKFLFTSVLGFMAMSLGVLAYSLYEREWDHWLHRQQYIVDEVCIYIASVFLFIFGSFMGAYNATLGWAFIALVCCYIVYNAITVLRWAL